MNSETPSPPLRGRLAPSPTGALHLGNARTFLLTWLSIRSRKGSLIYRLEDLDHPKIKSGAAQQAEDDLVWMGLDWDEGPGCEGALAPYEQSERTGDYRRALDELSRQNLLYPCVCSRKDVENAQSAPHANEYGMRYEGTCRGVFESFAAAQARIGEGRMPVWRFKSPEGRSTRFVDGVYGEQVLSVADDVGDFVIARHPDGAGYMLAVVVDDGAMGVTEVMRGEDLLPATHRQILLAEALGLPLPTYIHTPLMVGPDGRRLAKRHGDTRVASLREQGLAPEQLVGYLAWTLGWGAREQRLMPADLLDRYDPESIPVESFVCLPENLPI
jgi:glutamyl-tRNA synthetase